MARKNKGVTFKDVVDGLGQAAKEQETADPKVEVVQKIANLCTSIGDRSFVIRQAQSDITSYYVQIDQLRDQLRALEPVNVPEANPTK